MIIIMRHLVQFNATQPLPSSTMQNAIGPIRIFHLHRTFFFFYLF